MERLPCLLSSVLHYNKAGEETSKVAASLNYEAITMLKRSIWQFIKTSPEIADRTEYCCCSGTQATINERI